MSWITTNSGKHFDFLHPTVDMVDIRDIIHALSHTCRFNGHCSAFYSVAQHSIHVSELLPAPLKKLGLVHDAAEAYIGDLTAPLKNILPDYRDIEERVERVVFKALGIDFPMLNAAVKRADLIMLATEQRDLMPHTGERWHWESIPGIRPRPQHITVWNPNSAYFHFREALGEFYAELR